MSYSAINEIIEDIRNGKMVIIVDDEDRENEGDLIMAAQFVEAEHVTFFAREACGLICMPITEERAKQLKLPLMVSKNGSTHETNFTVSVEAAKGTTTGISALDRATTVKAAIAVDAQPSDLIQPGHIFPLIARKGGVLTRAGHTEAGCDLAKLAGLEPAAMIVEIMNTDGTMAKGDDLVKFANKHNLKIGTIADLIEYRTTNDKTVEKLDSKKIKTEFGVFDLHIFQDKVESLTHFALTQGTFDVTQPTLVRVQTIKTLRDLFQATGPDENSFEWSLSTAMKYISRNKAGAIVLLAHDDGNSVTDELTRLTQSPEPSTDEDTDKSNMHRVIGTGAQILSSLGVGKMRILGKPTKLNALSGFHLEAVEFVEKPSDNTVQFPIKTNNKNLLQSY